jgi:hypothetical protein
MPVFDRVESPVLNGKVVFSIPCGGSGDPPEKKLMNSRPLFSSARFHCVQEFNVTILHVSSVKEKLCINSVDFGFVEPTSRCCSE